MRIRTRIESMMPDVPREIVKGILRKTIYPDYGLSLGQINLKTYFVKNAQSASWSVDCQKPEGVLDNSYHFPHFLLARAVIGICHVRSWCDVGTACASLPLQVARLGVTNVLGIEGSDAALRAGKVMLPPSNYSVADVTIPLGILEEDGEPACFDVVSALELVEHLPDEKLPGLFDNIRCLHPKYVVLAIGLQPHEPYHVNLKSMKEWMKVISSMLPGWSYDERLSAKIFKLTRCHGRFRNDYPTNHFPLDRNLIIYVRQRQIYPKHSEVH